MCELHLSYLLNIPLYYKINMQVVLYILYKYYFGTHNIQA